MKAIRVKEFGPPEVMKFEKVADPTPAAPAEAQIDRSRFDAPRRWKNRRSRLLDWSLPIVPQ